jgi:hypothetical protein
VADGNDQVSNQIFGFHGRTQNFLQVVPRFNGNPILGYLRSEELGCRIFLNWLILLPAWESAGRFDKMQLIIRRISVAAGALGSNSTSENKKLSFPAMAEPDPPSPYSEAIHPF